MCKILYKKYDKKMIPQLPKVCFEGRIIVIRSPGETENAVDYLLGSPLLGIDTETRPSFKKGRQHMVSLLQVSNQEICFLFRLNYTGMTPAIIHLLEDKRVLKVGVSLHDDIISLMRRKSFTPGLFYDLQDHVGELGIEDKSLQKLYANFFGQKISKGAQLSNWEAENLSEKQRLYAATDAWACIQLYEEYQRLMRENNYTLVDLEEDNDNANENDI